MGLEGDCRSLGPAGNGASDVKMGSQRRSAGENEGIEGFEVCVEFVDGAFQPLGLSWDDAKGRGGCLAGGDGCGQISTEVEKVVLNRSEQGEDAWSVRRRIACRLDECQTENGIEFIHIAIRTDARRVFADARAGNQAGGAVVACLGVYLAEANRHEKSFFATTH